MPPGIRSNGFQAPLSPDEFRWLAQAGDVLDIHLDGAKVFAKTKLREKQVAAIRTFCETYLPAKVGG